MALATLREAVVTSGRFPLLSGVTCELEKGHTYVVTGPNGAGKTSFLRLLAGLETLSRGQAQVLGYDLASSDRRLVRRHIGWLGHEGSFYDELTVRENLDFAVAALRIDATRIDAALEAVGLAHRAHTVTKALSAGQRRRLGLAWLIIRRAELWLLDEPYASLDEEGRRYFGVVLEQAIGAGSTVVLTSHDPIDLAVPTSPLHLVGGRVIA